jgi:DNA-binding NarL/FixJ family response regulator
VRLILADSHNLVRAAIRHYLELRPGVDVVGEADTGRALLDEVAKLQPDLVITEFLLPDINGFDLTQSFRRHYPAVGLMFLTSSSDPGHAQTVLKLGARGFITKFSEPQELELALHSHRKGHTYVSAGLSSRILENRRRYRPEGTGTLTRRQREVLRMIGRGKSTKEIAQLMGVSTKTVETHRARLMQTLGLRGSSALTHFAVRNTQYHTD